MTDGVINPFSDTDEVRVVEELIQQEFWLQKEISDRCPALWTAIKKLLVVFPTPHFLEHNFSVIVHFAQSIEIEPRSLNLMI